MGGSLSVFQNGFDQGFNIPAPPLTEKNLPDQTGKVFLITGANSGVGYHLSSILYSQNATVYLACRTKSKADAAITNIKSSHPNSTGKLEFLSLDLSDLTTIKSSAEEFLSKETKLHWLDNNAGVMVPPRGSKGKQGHELQFATNILGPFLFTKLLLPVLHKTAETEPFGSVRVSWAGSFAVDSMCPKGGMEFAKNDDGDMTPKDFGGMDKAYGSTKVANWWLANEYGMRFGNKYGVLHDAFNPGNLDTGLQIHVGNWPIIGPLLVLAMRYTLLYPAVYGAYTELYAGLSPDLTLPQNQGAYIVPWGRKASWNRPDVVENIGEGKGSELLWEWCERETSQYA